MRNVAVYIAAALTAGLLGWLSSADMVEYFILYVLHTLLFLKLRDEKP